MREKTCSNSGTQTVNANIEHQIWFTIQTRDFLIKCSNNLKRPCKSLRINEKRNLKCIPPKVRYKLLQKVESEAVNTAIKLRNNEIKKLEEEFSVYRWRSTTYIMTRTIVISTCMKGG